MEYADGVGPEKARRRFFRGGWNLLCPPDMISSHQENQPTEALTAVRPILEKGVLHI
ncbi:hypothetical protein HMPREF1545_00807 [Oscillibacter sp. KLE 1728]|nr:hypothetical protein HMPREF1545_00807 [Oscillibacter sp. KLE 1728]